MCMATVVSKTHAVSPAHCVKSYEASYNKNKGPPHPLVAYIAVYINTIPYNIEGIATPDKYRFDQSFSYDIGVLRVSSLQNVEG